ncbi:hypothetical protein [Bacillus sp. AK031]
MSKWKKDFTNRNEIKRSMAAKIGLISISAVILILMIVFDSIGTADFSVPFAAAAIIVGVGNAIYFRKDIKALKNLAD